MAQRVIGLVSDDNEVSLCDEDCGGLRARFFICAVGTLTMWCYYGTDAPCREADRAVP